jgi:hypothetical protein
MASRWTVVDKLVHELGSLRAVAQEFESDPGLADADVTLELRNSLARAADAVHLVIGGDEGMVEKAWRTIAEAQEVGERARLALERSRATGRQSRVIRDRAKAQGSQTAREVADLRTLRDARLAGSGKGKQPVPRGPRSR